MSVPDTHVGLIIGKGGSQIKTIQYKSGARVKINSKLYLAEITADSQEKCLKAKDLINEII